VQSKGKCGKLEQDVKDMGERASVGTGPVQRGGGLGYEGVEKGVVVCSSEGYAPPANWRGTALSGAEADGQGARQAAKRAGPRERVELAGGTGG